MVKINDLFILHNANSIGFKNYESGNTRFVSNGFYNNGVVGFVKPRPSDRVFHFRAICVSAFCEATVQDPPFLPRGNGGSGLIVLEPRQKMSYEEMLYYSAYINKRISWRFSFGRMVTKDRLAQLEIEEYDGTIHPSKSIEELMPAKPQKTNLAPHRISFANVKLSRMFKIVRGRGAYRNALSSGNTPLVSATSSDTGILDYVDIRPTFKAPAITVERVSGRAFVQLRDFATVPADVSVLIPKDPKIPLSLLFIVAHMINSEQWRYSYGRKLTKGRLKKMLIPIPINQEGKIDYELGNELLDCCYGWRDIVDAYSHFSAERQDKTLESFLF